MHRAFFCYENRKNHEIDDSSDIVSHLGPVRYCFAFYGHFAVAPQGQIHDSVLIGSGETFTFAGALLGIEYAAKTAVLKIKQELKDESGQ